MDDALKIHKAGPWPMGFENDGASTSTWRAVTTTGTVTTTTTTTIVCGSFGLGVVLVAAWCGGIIGTGRICMHGGGGAEKINNTKQKTSGWHHSPRHHGPSRAQGVS